jgi:hypothetical protein
LEECPNCKKFSFHIDSKKQIGICNDCGYQEHIDQNVWNLKYDTGYKELRAVLKCSSLRRNHVIVYFELEKPNSPYAPYLLTNDVIDALKQEAPEIYSNLVKSSAIKCAP